ncbi:MAG: hypothetical protein GY696_05780 [Gammaproteobacteria bacterium]|nr:hypothetical protein [Gammaproteobacteria bacterium]
MSDSISSTKLSQYWRKHIDSCRGSGESAAAYCEHQHLVYHRFIYWRQKFQQQDCRNQLAPSESAGFSRVVTSHCDSPPGLSLALPNGLVIQVISEANVSVVRQLLAVL